MSKSNAGIAAYWLLTAALFVTGAALVGLVSPPIEGMGATQRIFYLHMPVAAAMLAAATVVFIASVGYLTSRRMLWDDLAEASAMAAVVLGAVVLITGSIWARSAWGKWWYWTPKLTFSLVLWLLYLVYVMIRPAVESPPRRALVCAVFGVVAFLDVPLVWLSARLIPDPLHPPQISLEGAAVKLIAFFWFLPVGAMTVGLIVARYRLHRARSAASTPGD